MNRYLGRGTFSGGRDRKGKRVKREKGLRFAGETGMDITAG